MCWCMQGLYHQAILGDLNTMAHGIARLSPHYCCDHMRLWSLGQPEALFWHRTVFSVMDPDYQPDRDGLPRGESAQESHLSLSWSSPTAAAPGRSLGCCYVSDAGISMAQCGQQSRSRCLKV